ncbi:hypothetical protein CONCODRAFT_77491 [Conidiobolus coronatus NRRL 28638]|uniref:Uncharacterized protein n=1 Tax=Conidiobolus coronatus (strain ATCC 28846 / CBS 209.66 / NRRL 28638) TaxID=796925 RepID=A0A137PDG7_CONC2|nr:hypothetical protein CONCODRAFT_77491 [Conidiobolus coronatus NRRL 28638]|eukprot:KXN73030.1 hypothetical protein CONCODRAFT_77491 [Conidiobolus coronatus NRRL 28638]
MSSEGASDIERIILAARSDQVEELVEILKTSDNIDINGTDSIGQTALHWACIAGSYECAEALLSFETINTDLQDLVLRETPLHKVFNPVKSPKISEILVGLLLEQSAKYKLKNREGLSAVDLVPKDKEFEEVRQQLLQAEASSLLDLPVEDSDDDGTASDISE